MRKYAIDLLSTDSILDHRSGRIINIIWLKPNKELNYIDVFAYFEDTGEPWEVRLDYDAEVRLIGPRLG